MAPVAPADNSRQPRSSFSTFDTNAPSGQVHHRADIGRRCDTRSCARGDDVGIRRVGVPPLQRGARRISSFGRNLRDIELWETKTSASAPRRSRWMVSTSSYTAPYSISQPPSWKRRSPLQCVRPAIRQLSGTIRRTSPCRCVFFVSLVQFSETRESATGESIRLRQLYDG